MTEAVGSRARTALRLGLSSLAAAALSAALAGCGANTALSNAALAPLDVLSATDVVFETNLQSAVEGGQTQVGLSAISGTAGVGGIPETSGAPTSTGEVSVATLTGVVVYTAYNPVDRHCLGTLVLSVGSPTVLGESVPGTFDFWLGPTTAQSCTASDFTTDGDRALWLGEQRPFFHGLAESLSRRRARPIGRQENRQVAPCEPLHSWALGSVPRRERHLLVKDQTSAAGSPPSIPALRYRAYPRGPDETLRLFPVRWKGLCPKAP